MTRTDVRLSTDDVVRAAARIGPHVWRTPLLEPGSLPGIRLKAENLQRSGSFKIRGAANALLSGPRRDVVAGSSGNHGIAVATLGRSLGIGVTIVMAAGASETKAALLRRLGARVRYVEGGVLERDRYARDHAAATGALLLPSSDHELVVAGQGTVGLEVLQDGPDLDAIFVPTGGGGLLAGICLAALNSSVRVIGVEPAGSPRYALSVPVGRPVSVPPPATVADGLRGQCPGSVTFPIILDRVDDLVGVGDDAVVRAMDLLRRSGVAAEPSGSVALAGALEYRPTGKVAVIVSGGNGLPATQPSIAQQRGTS